MPRFAVQKYALVAAHKAFLELYLAFMQKTNSIIYDVKGILNVPVVAKLYRIENSNIRKAGKKRSIFVLIIIS
jgi:hypothetical protein